jgi:hypothetical protein
MFDEKVMEKDIGKREGSASSTVSRDMKVGGRG